MSHQTISVRDALYETPGKQARKQIVVATWISLLALLILVVLIVRKFQQTGQLDAKYWFFFGKLTTWRFILEGITGTLQAAVAAGFFAFVFGFFYVVARISHYKALHLLGVALTEFTRGVPTLLFIYFFFLVLPQLGVHLPSILRIALPVAISASGVVAEVLRSGIHAVPKGQREAALSLGMREVRIFLKIIFPQAIRIIIPSLIAEMVIVVKDTTFSYVVNYPDLMQNAKVLISNYDALLSVYLMVAIIYVLINAFLNHISVKIARRNIR